MQGLFLLGFFVRSIYKLLSFVVDKKQKSNKNHKKRKTYMWGETSLLLCALLFRIFRKKLFVKPTTEPLFCQQFIRPLFSAPYLPLQTHNKTYRADAPMIWWWIVCDRHQRQDYHRVMPLNSAIDIIVSVYESIPIKAKSFEVSKNHRQISTKYGKGKDTHEHSTKWKEQ